MRNPAQALMALGGFGILLMMVVGFGVWGFAGYEIYDWVTTMLTTGADPMNGGVATLIGLVAGFILGAICAKVSLFILGIIAMIILGIFGAAAGSRR